MYKIIQQVTEFHRIFGGNIEEKPVIPSNERCELRRKLIQEELDEFVEAYKKGDLEAVADALADLQYVVTGSVIEFGLQSRFVEIFNEVHNSNMSKLDESGKPVMRDDGKIMKGKNYFTPDLKTILERPEYSIKELDDEFSVATKPFEDIELIYISCKYLLEVVRKQCKHLKKSHMEDKEIFEKKWQYRGIPIVINEITPTFSMKRREYASLS